MVGVPISSLDEEEVYNFQSTMARLRYLESKNKRTLQIMDRSSKLRLSIHLADPTSIFQKDSKPQKLLITVHMPLLKLRKTVSVGGKSSPGFDPHPVLICNLIEQRMSLLMHY